MLNLPIGDNMLIIQCYEDSSDEVPTAIDDLAELGDSMEELKTTIIDSGEA